jgi:hypothetical protein
MQTEFGVDELHHHTCAQRSAGPVQWVLAGFSRPGQSHVNSVTAPTHPSAALHDPVLTGRETNGPTASGVM